MTNSSNKQNHKAVSAWSTSVVSFCTLCASGPLRDQAIKLKGISQSSALLNAAQTYSFFF